MNTASSPESVLDYWFGPAPERDLPARKRMWFGKNEETDRTIRQRFLEIYESAAAGGLDQWQATPTSCLALILVLDQFPRNMFRDTARAFAADGLARRWARHAVANRYDRSLTPLARLFLYLPFEHSEDIEDQTLCLRLFADLASMPETADGAEYAKRHYDIVARFGRFPHRNRILGRQSTSEEADFLQRPGSSF